MSDLVVLNPNFSSEGWNTIVIDVDGAELADVSCAIAPAFVSALHDCDAIRVYGYYLPGNATPAVTCLVDGAAVAVSDPPSSLDAGNSNYARWLICQVNNLSHYTHTVELTVTNVFTPNSFCFDLMEAHPVALAAQPESTQNNSTTTADSPPPHKDDKDDSDTDAYVVITVVATALGGMIWLCWRWWRRWHERKRARVSSAPRAQDNGTENIEEDQPTHTSKTVQTGIFFFS